VSRSARPESRKGCGTRADRSLGEMVMSRDMLLDLGLRRDLGAAAVRARPGLPGLAACSESAAPRDLG
jgi:hypothetical protein